MLTFEPMPSSILHFVAWWSLLAALPLFWALRAHTPMRRDERVFRLMLVASPLMLAAIWLHGVLIDPPNHWARAEAHHFFAVWFRPREAAFYVDHAHWLLAVAAPVVVIALLLTYRGTRLVEHAWNRRTAAIAFGLQVAGWLLLRPLAGVLVEVGEALRWRAPAAVLSAEAQDIAVAVCIPLPVIAIAFMFARLSVEAAARRNPRPSRAR
jgi:hypothetical protein